jgi:uncharacterized protein YbjT (DUF2867 family)
MGLQRTALLVGATGLIGDGLLELLLEDEYYDKVVVLARRRLTFDYPTLVQHIIDFNSLEVSASLVQANDVFCCLGTTIKKAGSREAFRKVDYEYPLKIAELAADHGANQFLIVTALGADPNSTIFYSRIKGEIEQAVSKLPFRCVHIFRPSILVGERREFRLGESMGIALMRFFSFLMVGSWRKYSPIRAEVVAKAMIAAAKTNHPSVSIYESDVMHQMAGLPV